MSNIEINKTVIQDNDYPEHEILQLPSKGYFYKSQLPISSGKIRLKYPTARQEDILLSKNLMQKRTIMDEYLRALILQKNVRVQDLLLADKNYLLIASRVLANGSKYTFKKTCQICNTLQDVTVQLGALPFKDVNFQIFQKGVNQFELTLPKSKKTITLKFIDGYASKLIDKQIQQHKKIEKITGVGNQMTTRYKYLITSVDGNRQPNAICSFIQKQLYSLDSTFIKQKIAQLQPGVNMKYQFECDTCGFRKTQQIPIDVSFFYPSVQ